LYNFKVFGFPPRPADSAKLSAASESFQLFFQSASRNYVDWERRDGKLLEVKGNLIGKYFGAFLIWVRKCYVNLVDMLGKEAAGQSSFYWGHRAQGSPSSLSFGLVIWQ
jgi:hypothetical protein